MNFPLGLKPSKKPESDDNFATLEQAHSRSSKDNLKTPLGLVIVTTGKIYSNQLNSKNTSHPGDENCVYLFVVLLRELGNQNLLTCHHSCSNK